MFFFLTIIVYDGYDDYDSREILIVTILMMILMNELMIMLFTMTISKKRKLWMLHCVHAPLLHYWSEGPHLPSGGDN